MMLARISACHCEESATKQSLVAHAFDSCTNSLQEDNAVCKRLLRFARNDIGMVIVFMKSGNKVI